MSTITLHRDVTERTERVQERIRKACARTGRDPASVTLVAVTKGQSAEVIQAGYEAGLRHFGENRVQEALPKIEEASNKGVEATWHLIGHLQSNKTKAAASAFDVIHSIDSTRLMYRLDTAAPTSRDVLLQINVAGEAQKGGISVNEVSPLIAAAHETPNLRLRGLMTIAPIASDPEQVRPIFRALRLLATQFSFPELSMGMTNDFEVAIEEGATLVRVGRALFGERTL
ncbi:MAG: YggS family pyridoxal phosphate-dependent enzyme [Dehalococcoidia bacterium]|nr:YggS family pyridoxal phosphate-dependent enzyme [Dehalococcoidia bacterium]|tara:strand:+ start:1647 stop:2333 length:687 start_codon:yes stop_codon:yes gene_type:complete